MIDSSVYWPAPAKLNLFLHITGRRADGYHLLQSVFQFLNWGDELAFEITENGQISRQTEIAGVAEADDLIIRAARLLQQSSATKAGARISVKKILPMGGGLGGGSSDAATTLVVLNQLWQCGLSRQQLADLGLTLGADVPVFIHGVAAFVEGVGERISAIDVPEKWFFVLHPQINVSTAKIFNDSGLTRDCAAIRICDLSGAVLGNVCEAIACKHYPEIAEAIEWLSGYNRHARMTGTGACVFAEFDSQHEAEELLQRLPEKWQGFVAKGVNQSPLYQQLAANGFVIP
ncbi:MAG: 4-(cytidine 5'-diphospho)-2-C-methyl-D-erythritol kinase [Gammaproteobacteria bacterium]|nr:4-(cytidine 5'-diphospho)-2-C-methyl-D-erythritol kinase [Gammaproteobacteria bacterium]